MGPAGHAIANGVMTRGQEFVSADLQRDTRIHNSAVRAVVAFPLSCRGRKVGAIIGLDRLASAREPRLSMTMLHAVRILLDPAAVALDNAILPKHAEPLSG